MEGGESSPPPSSPTSPGPLQELCFEMCQEVRVQLDVSHADCVAAAKIVLNRLARYGVTLDRRRLDRMLKSDMDAAQTQSAFFDRSYDVKLQLQLGEEISMLRERDHYLADDWVDLLERLSNSMSKAHSEWTRFALDARQYRLVRDLIDFRLRSQLFSLDRGSSVDAIPIYWSLVLKLALDADPVRMAIELIRSSCLNELVGDIDRLTYRVAQSSDARECCQVLSAITQCCARLYSVTRRRGSGSDDALLFFSLDEWDASRVHNLLDAADRLLREAESQALVLAGESLVVLLLALHSAKYSALSPNKSGHSPPPPPSESPSSIVIDALESRPSTSDTCELASTMLSWLNRPNDLKSSLGVPPDIVWQQLMRFLVDLSRRSEATLLAFFHEQDLAVLVDIAVRHVRNLPPTSMDRIRCRQLLVNLCATLCEAQCPPICRQVVEELREEDERIRMEESVAPFNRVTAV